MQQHTALLIIDVQVNLIEPAYRSSEVLANIQTLLARARATGTPVVYIQHDGPQGHDLHLGTPGWHIHPAIAPLDGELVVHKESSDAFYETILQSELEKLGITHLVVAGGQTEYCVDTTVRRAVSNGYQVTLVSDAHTTFDTEHLTAAQIIAHHNWLLTGFWAGKHEVAVRPTQEIVFAAAHLVNR